MTVGRGPLQQLQQQQHLLIGVVPRLPSMGPKTTLTTQEESATAARTYEQTDGKLCDAAAGGVGWGGGGCQLLSKAGGH